MHLSFGHEPTPPPVAAMGDHLEITLHIGPEDAAALGGEAGLLTDWFLTALRALVALRMGEVDRETETGQIVRGPATVDTWYWVINDLGTRLTPRLEGIIAAAIRAHAAAGGSIGNLALAMDVAPRRSTAQTRREKVLDTEPSGWELWATDGGPRRASNKTNSH